MKWGKRKARPTLFEILYHYWVRWIEFPLRETWLFRWSLLPRWSLQVRSGYLRLRHLRCLRTADENATSSSFLYHLLRIDLRSSYYFTSCRLCWRLARNLLKHWSLATSMWLEKRGTQKETSLQWKCADTGMSATDEPIANNIMAFLSPTVVNSIEFSCEFSLFFHNKS